MKIMNPSMFRPVYSFLTALLAMTLFGCSGGPRTYAEGGDASAPDLTKITCSAERNSTIAPGTNGAVTIQSIDGKELTNVGDFLFSGPAARDGGVDVAYLKPGRHELGLHWKDGDISSGIGWWFVAEAGKSYVIHGVKNDDSKFLGLDPGTTKFWIEEVGTGTHVGGRIVRK